MSRLSGTVTRSGNPQENAKVYVVDRDTNSVVATTTTDANGEWQVSGLATNAEERYHALTEYDDGAQQYNALSLPYLSTDAYLAAPTSTLEMQHPQASLPSAIPDSVVNNLDYWYPMDEGSGTTLNETVSGSAINATLNGGGWQDNSTFWGGTAPSLDGVDDWWNADSSFGVGSNVALCGWFRIDGSLQDAIIIQLFDSTTSLNTGFRIQARSNGDLRLQAFEGGNGGTYITLPGVLSTDTWYFIGSNAAVDDVDLYIWNNSALQDSSTGAGTSGRDPLTTDMFPSGGKGLSDIQYLGGLVDASGYNSDTRLSQSDFDSIWSDTRR